MEELMKSRLEASQIAAKELRTYFSLDGWILD
jgi:hypothetical protein